MASPLESFVNTVRNFSQQGSVPCIWLYNCMVRFELLSRDNMGFYHARRIVMSSSIVPRDVGDWSLGIGSRDPDVELYSLHVGNPTSS